MIPLLEALPVYRNADTRVVSGSVQRMNRNREDVIITEIHSPDQIFRNAQGIFSSGMIRRRIRLMTETLQIPGKISPRRSLQLRFFLLKSYHSLSC